MKFNQLFNLQQKISGIYPLNPRINKDLLLPKKILSLQASIGNLATKTNSIYYWEDHPSFQKDSIVDCYNEALSTILSIGIDIECTDLSLNIRPTNYPLTDQLLDIYIDISDFFICTSEDQYYTLLEDFLTLGNSLGFAYDELERNFNNFVSRHFTNLKFLV